LTKRQARTVKLKKQAESYKARGYVKAGKSWVKAGSRAFRAWKDSRVRR
jgi:hypothetical protein